MGRVEAREPRVMSFEPFAEGEEEEDEVHKHLEGRDECAIHVFTATWCGHCENFKRSAPELFGADEVDGTPVVHHDDADREEWKGKWICRGYPTVIFVNEDGERREYDGERTTAAIVDAFRAFCH